jgi:acetyl-CoA carboxylase biotin carboxyl carrier protein
MIDLEFVESLIRALDSSSLDFLELERGGTRIRLSKSPVSNSTSVVASNANGLPAQGNFGGIATPLPNPVVPGPAASPVGEAVVETGSDEGQAHGGLIEVTSPMVGTFYRAPSPDSAPYVEVGTRVGEGTVLCIIEAMKLMNELECEAEGTIAKVLVENAQPVEYGQVLFLIDPS